MRVDINSIVKSAKGLVKNAAVFVSKNKHEAIIRMMKEEADADKERLDYLQSLNILLQQAIKDLKKDLGEVA